MMKTKEEKGRCSAELHLESYFGFKDLGEENEIITADYGQFVNMLVTYRDAQLAKHKELNAELISSLKECMNYVAAESKTRHGHASKLWDKCNDLITKAEQSNLV